MPLANPGQILKCNSLFAACFAVQAGKIRNDNMALCLYNNDPVIFQRTDLPAYCLYGQAQFNLASPVSSPRLAVPMLTIMPLSRKNRGQYIPPR
jgi:hypothetical protein